MTQPWSSRQQQVAEWLRANHIDADIVPLDADITIATRDDGGRQLAVEVLVPGEDGRFMLDERGQAPARDVQWVPLAVPPPEWWKPYEKPTREQLQQQLDTVYRERHALLARYAASCPAILCPADDVDEPGWRILHLVDGDHSHTWHIPPADLDLFPHVEQVDGDDPRAQWDGHGTAEKYQRIADRIRHLTCQILDEGGQGVCVCTVDQKCATCRRDAPVAVTAHDPTEHAVYLSTACQHGEHGYCQSDTGQSGCKRPAQCKFCGKACACPCHHSEAGETWTDGKTVTPPPAPREGAR